MAGGLIIVLGLKFQKDGTVIDSDQTICGNELGTGIHRGKIILRTDEGLEPKLGVGAKLYELTEDCKTEITPLINELCEIFGIPPEILGNKPFKVIKPISKRPYGGNYCGQLI